MSQTTALTSFPAPGRWANRGTWREWSVEDLVSIVERPELWPSSETIANSRDQLPAYAFARYEQNMRISSRDPDVEARATAERVIDVWGLAVEYVDDPTIDAVKIRDWWGEHFHIAFTTGYHDRSLGGRPPGPRWRVLLPFSRPASMDEAKVVAAWAMHPKHEVGVVDPVTAQVWRHWFAPAINPGLPDRVACTNRPMVEPLAAHRELLRWESGLTQGVAHEALDGTSINELAAAFARRQRANLQHARLFMPENLKDLDDRLGPSWPGRVFSLAGPRGSGRTAFAVQWVEAVCRAARPVFFATTDDSEEVVARLLGLEHDTPHRDIASGVWSPTLLRERSTALGERCPRLHIWSPKRSERSLDTLLGRASALATAYGGRVPLVVVDSVEAFGADGLALRDLARPRGLSDDWPGAVVLGISSEGFDADVNLQVTGAEGGWMRLAASHNQHGDVGSWIFDFDAAVGKIGVRRET